MKDLFGQITEHVQNISEEIGKQTEKVLEGQKLKRQLRKLRNDRDKEFEKIGRLHYEMYKNGELLHPTFEEYFASLKDKELVIRYLQEKLSKYQDKIPCESCGTLIAGTYQYCPKCGKMRTGNARTAEDDYETEDIFEMEEEDELKARRLLLQLESEVMDEEE